MAVYRGTFAFDRFTIVPNAWVRDKRLTMADKGLLAYILSHSPEYPLTVEQVIGESKDGADAISTAMKRLEKVGYLRRQRQRDPETGRLGPYDWYLQEPVDAGDSQSDNPATGSDQGERDVSAGHTQSDFPSPGFTSLAKVGTKKTTPKNTIKEDQETSSSRASSSSSTPARKPRSEEDEEARAKQIDDQAINARDQKQYRAAVRAIVRRLGTDTECAEATIARLHELVEESERQPIGNIERYVRRIPDDQLAGHLEEATWEIEAERAEDANRHAVADGIVAQVANNHPDAGPDQLDDLRSAYVAALRAGHDSDAIVAALNDTHGRTRRGDPIDDYIGAIEALGQPVAA